MGYLYLTNTSLSIGVQSLSKETSVVWTKLQNPSSSTYHYEGWVYIKTKPSSDTSILERDGDKLQLNGTKLQFVHKTTGNAENKIDITEDFPLQKWVYIVVNVVNGNIVEVYLNGKLVITKQVTVTVPGTKTVLKYGKDNAVIEGYITKVKRDPVALTPDEVSKKYFEGNGLATFTNFLAGYNASFSLFNTEGTIKEYTAL